MIICGVDLETTGLDVNKDFITELGFVIKKHRHNKPLTLGQSFLHAEGQPPIPKEITELTGIEDWMIEAYGKMPGIVIRTWLQRCMEYKVTAFCGQNAKGFDKPFLENYMQRYMNEADLLKYYQSIPWIDTKIDVEYPKTVRSRNLVGIAAEHGFLNPYPHAAVFDSMTCLKVLDHYSLEECLEPRITVFSDTTYQTKDLAKNRGFNYNPETKRWSKSVRVSKLPEEVAQNTAAGFKTLEA